MDFQGLLCGLPLDKLRKRPVFSLPSRLPSLPSRPGKYGPTRTRTKNKRKHLPVGSGEHTVGCVDLMNGNASDGTFVRLYYPTFPANVMERENQWPLWLPRKHYGKGYVYFRRMNTKVFGTLLNWIGGEYFVPALWQAPVLSSGHRFPVVLFSHGLGGNRTTNTTVCCELASQGFVVAAIEHRDGSASMTYHLRPTLSPDLRPSGSEEEEEDEDDFFHQHHSIQEEWKRYERQEPEDDYTIRNKQVHVRAEEMKRMLDLLESLNAGNKVHNLLKYHFDFTQFKGLLDLDRVGIVGHSFGGATSIATLSKDARFKVGVALDSWMLPLEDDLYAKVTQPTLLVNTETFQWAENVRSMQRLGVNQGSDLDRVMITVRGTCHQSSTDFQFMINKQFGMLLSLRHTLSPRLSMALQMKATLGFLHKHLDIADKCHHEDILSGNNSHVILGTNVDLSDTSPACKD